MTQSSLATQDNGSPAQELPEKQAEKKEEKKNVVRFEVLEEAMDSALAEELFWQSRLD